MHASPLSLSVSLYRLAKTLNLKSITLNTHKAQALNNKGLLLLWAQVRGCALAVPGDGGIRAEAAPHTQVGPCRGCEYCKPVRPVVYRFLKESLHCPLFGFCLALS